MSYTPTEWKTGDVITAPKLNNIEQGIVDVGNIVVATVSSQDGQTFSCDKTYEEIKDAIENKKNTLFHAITPINVSCTTCVFIQNNIINVQFAPHIINTPGESAILITYTYGTLDSDNNLNVYSNTYRVNLAKP